MKSILLITIVLVIVLMSSFTVKSVKEHLIPLGCIQANELKDTMTYECTDTSVVHCFSRDDKIELQTIVIHRDTFKNQSLLLLATEPLDAKYAYPSGTPMLGIRLTDKENGKISYEEYFAQTGTMYISGLNFKYYKLKNNFLLFVETYTTGAGGPSIEGDIYAFVNNRYQCILSIGEYVADDNEMRGETKKKYSYDTFLDIIDDNSTFPVIRAIKKGTIWDKHKNKVMPINETVTYGFNASKEIYELPKN